ncbi:MAG: hypothetical protein JST92_08485 [Deltaproteobacteria bacterium]|nr:hypothetical protein [Deltaproteobacteria bacterium]
MQRLRWARPAGLPLALLLSACAGALDIGQQNESGQDASTSDAATANDAGQQDAGQAADAGTGTDAGNTGTDAGSSDAGQDTDSGTSADAGGAGSDDAGTAGGDQDGGAGDDAGTDGGVITAQNDGGVFVPLSVSVSVAKVKQLLTGLPPTNEEVAAVAANPSALKDLVVQWTALPQYTGKMLAFFSTAFQQSQAAQGDFADAAQELPETALLQDLRESFARTALQLISEGRPFTETMTTRRFMLTSRLKTYYAYVDERAVNDNGSTSDTLLKTNPTFQFTQQSSMGPIPPEQSFDPASPNFMVFYNKNIKGSYDANCPFDPIVYKQQAGFSSVMESFYQNVFIGSSIGFNVTLSDGTQHGCNPPAAPSIFVASDYTDWTMVNTRQPGSGETITPFYMLPALRAATELVLNIPRVGFFTTPAFLATWNTNNSNQARVTLNQTLIVALGKSIDGTDKTQPQSLAALDQAHADPSTACFSCHIQLDPMRQFFRQTYSYAFHEQTAAAQTSLPGQFAFQGVSVAGSNIFDLGTQLSGHPRFAAAWSQKLCTWATSAPCNEDDPEFMRIVAAFKSSNYQWPVLVKELFSSPLVTYQANTATVAANGETFPLARRDHLCAAISNRLGLPNACGLDVNTPYPSGLSGTVRTVANALPSDQFSRGVEGAILANDPSMVFRTGMESLCGALADKLVDNGSASRYKSTDPTTAIADMVHTLMGITGDRDAPRIAILTDHFTHAKRPAQGSAPAISATDALKSTFVLACLSPSVVGVGQ